MAARLLYLTLTGMLSWMALLEFIVFTFERPGVLGRTPPQGVPQGRGAPRFTTASEQVDWAKTNDPQPATGLTIQPVLDAVR